MKLRDELRDSFHRLGTSGVQQVLFEGMALTDETVSGVMASLLAGHHLLFAGPPGVGKTTLAQRIVRLLPDRSVVASCPLGCHIDHPECPWCLQSQVHGEPLPKKTLPGGSRVRKVSGSGELTVADLVGDLDPQMALEYGILDLRAFIPGKLLRANGCVLLIDFIDRIPERVLNAVLGCLSGDRISVGRIDHTFPIDFLIVATGAASTPAKMPIDLADHFDIIVLDNVADQEFEERLLSERSPTALWKRPAVQVVQRSRHHEDLSRGISTRGAIRYGELLASYAGILGDDRPDTLLPEASKVSLPHRVEVAPHAVANRSAKEIIDEIVAGVIGSPAPQDGAVPLEKDKMLAIVEEIARMDHFRKPLKFGLFDLLLKRIKRFPESELARLHNQMFDRLVQKYQERHMDDNVTFELLADIEEVRKREERLSAELRARLEAEALVKTISMLEEHQLLSRSRRGYNLSRRGIALLLEKLAPRLWEGSQLTGQGKHRTGKKLPFGEGRIIGTRAWRFGDRYRDVSFRDTMRQAIRNRHTSITREDIQVVKRDIRTRMDIILCLDLSGTMNQLDKLWYAKESAIALSLASSNYGDRVGLVTFSNLATVVSDLTVNTYRLTEKVLDLDLHENAFTNLGYGLVTARSLFARRSRSHSKQHVILVSDGDATAPHPSPGRYALREAAKCIRKGITISCICINEENADPELMHTIARIGRGRVTIIGDTQAMKEGIIEEMKIAIH